MLKRSLDGVDRELLRTAVGAGLQNQDGRARGTVGGIYQQLTYEEIKPLLSAIHEAIVVPAPSGIMFASGIRLAGIDPLARHHIREGMPLCIEVMDIQNWGKRHRISQCLKTLGQYGDAAKPMLPRLRQLDKDLLAHHEARGLQPQIDQLRSLIKEIENVIRHNGSFVRTKGYCTDLFFTAALGWIKAQKNKDAPFFAYITTNAPHGPFIAPPKNRDPSATL